MEFSTLANTALSLLGGFLVGRLSRKLDTNDRQKEKKKLAKEQMDKEYDCFKTVEKKMPELFDAFRAELKKDSGFKCYYYIAAGGLVNYCDIADSSNIFFEALLVPRYKQAPLKAYQCKDDLEHENYITQNRENTYYLNDLFIELLLKETKK